MLRFVIIFNDCYVIFNDCYIFYFSIYLLYTYKIQNSKYAYNCKLKVWSTCSFLRYKVRDYLINVPAIHFYYFNINEAYKKTSIILTGGVVKTYARIATLFQRTWFSFFSFPAWIYTYFVYSTNRSDIFSWNIDDKIL